MLIYQVYVNSDDEVELHMIVRTPGWTGITGGHKVGKTTQLLQVAHHFQAESKLDVLWIDFAALDYSDVDGIARITSQLFIRGCQLLSHLDSALTTYLSKLKPGSLVVFDNIATSNSTLQTEPRNLFLLHFFQLCSKFQSTLSFVVVADDLEHLRSIIRFEKRHTLGPLEPEHALELSRQVLEVCS